MGVKEYHQKAIELKYKGHTYREISKAIGGRISEGVLRKYFTIDGKLYIPYLTFEAAQNSFREEDIRTQFKRQAQRVYRIWDSLIQKALEAGDYQLAFNITKEQLDRAGIVTVRKAEVNVEQKNTTVIETHEQYLSELERLGIDPETGLRVARA